MVGPSKGVRYGGKDFKKTLHSSLMTKIIMPVIYVDSVSENDYVESEHEISERQHI